MNVLELDINYFNVYLYIFVYHDNFPFTMSTMII